MRRKRSFVHDPAMGPKAPRSTVLTPEEEAMAVAFRRHALLPLDDCLYALQASARPCTGASSATGSAICSRSRARRRGSGHQALAARLLPHRHRRGADTGGQGPPLRGVDRTSKYAFAGLKPRATAQAATEFLKELVTAVPHRIHTVLADNGIQFADLPRNRDKPAALWRGHPFPRACAAHGVDHRLTKPKHPWANGKVERMNRTLKEAAVRRYHYDTVRQLELHLAAFLDAYDFAKRLKTLQGLTPYEAICNAWADQPERFIRDPVHLTSGLNS